MDGHSNKIGRGIAHPATRNRGAGHSGAGHSGAGHSGAGHSGAGHSGAGHSGAGSPELGEGRVLLGPVWRENETHWQKFYPDGLPSEWNLNYVAHYWHTILLPASEWVQWSAPERDWSEAPEQFRLFFQLPAQTDVTTVPASRLFAALGERLGGFLLTGAMHLDIPESWQHLVYSSEVNLNPLLPGFPDTAFSVFGHSARRIVMLEALPALPPRVLRALLEALVTACDDGRELILFLPGTPQDIEQAIAIGRLLGLGTLKSRQSGASG